MVPKGIEERHHANGEVFYRTRIRRRGFNLRADFETVEEALAWRARSLRDIREGRIPTLPAHAAPEAAQEVVPALGVVTVEDACRNLIKGIQAGTIPTKQGTAYKGSVLLKYESMLRVHALDAEHGIGGMDIREIEPADARDFINRLVKRKSAGTAQKVLTALKVVGHQAVADRIITFNPFASVSAPGVREKPIRVLTIDEADRIRAAARRLDEKKKQSRAYPLIELAFSTGLRSGEMLALRYGPDSLDLKRGVVVVGPEGNLSRTRGADRKFPLIAPKTLASEREVELPPSLVQVLREHRLATGHPGDGQFVFANAQGNPLCGSTQVYRDCWRAALTDASIPDPRPRLHDARHHWAIFMLRAGVQPQAVMKLGGWSSLTMLLNRYGKHALPGEEKGSGATLDAYFDTQRAAAQG